MEDLTIVYDDIVTTFDYTPDWGRDVETSSLPEKPEYPVPYVYSISNSGFV